MNEDGLRELIRQWRDEATESAKWADPHSHLRINTLRLCPQQLEDALDK